MSIYDRFNQYLNASIAVKKTICGDIKLSKNIEVAIQLISNCFASGGKLLIAGNGGSAADAQHFAAELVGKYQRERKARPAIALTTNSSTITAWSNDYNFDDVFARQLEAFGNPNDIFVGISTSGNSKNIVKAVKKAKLLSIKSICLLGNSGGALRNLPDIAIIIPEKQTPHIQESHITLIHFICGEVEKTFKN